MTLYRVNTRQVLDSWLRFLIYNIISSLLYLIEGQGEHLPLQYSSVATGLLASSSVTCIGDVLDVCADLVFARCH